MGKYDPFKGKTVAAVDDSSSDHVTFFFTDGSHYVLVNEEETDYLLSSELNADRLIILIAQPRGE